MAYDFNKTMAGINADIDKTIAKITELMLLIGSLGKISGGGGSSTTYSDNSLFNSNSQADAYQRFKAKERADEATYNITNNINNTVNAQEIADMTIRNIKYGQIVTAGGY
jgi:hypothetical protein